MKHGCNLLCQHCHRTPMIFFVTKSASYNSSLWGFLGAVNEMKAKERDVYHTTICLYMKWEKDMEGNPAQRYRFWIWMSTCIYIYSLLWWNSYPYYFSDRNRLLRTCSGECSAQGPSLLWFIPNQVNFRQAPCKQDYNACKTMRDRRSCGSNLATQKIYIPWNWLATLS